jgi:methionyl-tRNA formyltransferase
MNGPKTLILLTSTFYTKRLIESAYNKTPDISVVYVQHPNELMELDIDFLKFSRLISFGSAHYIKPHILSLIGFGSYNFHPGPSNYPGWAPFSFALYEKASNFGVTVHEMTPQIDAGIIVGTKNFKIPNACDLQLLMDLTTEVMYQLFDELVLDFAKRDTSLLSNNEDWSGHIWTKSDFKNMCHIPLDISKEEMDRRIVAFGYSDGINLPFIDLNNDKYLIADPDDNTVRDDIYIQGYRFIKVN